LTVASDVYALGVVLYQLLTGHRPHQVPGQKDDDEVARILSGQEPIPPHVWRPGLPPDLEQICLKCLEKAPQRRYASAAALAEDLGRFQAGEPIQLNTLGGHRPSPVDEPIQQRRAVSRFLIRAACLAGMVLAVSAWFLFPRPLPPIAPMDLVLRAVEDDDRGTLADFQSHYRTDFNIRLPDGDTLLHRAVLWGSEEAARFLIDHGADPNAPDTSGRTPLHRAAEGGQLALVEYLLANGARIQAKDDEGETPLHIAAWYGKREVVKLLIHQGAKLRAKDDSGNTPLDLARERRHDTIVAYLREMNTRLSHR
jgi:serine/threonine protein kinase